MSELRLRAPRLEDEAAVLAAHKELLTDDFEFLFGAGSWSERLARIEQTRNGVDLPDGRVPASFLLAVVEDEAGVEQVVGRVSIRHRLNEALQEVGGHVGYAVRPGFRGRGYATRILQLPLEVLRDLGVDHALVTCDDDNAPSARTIEKCAGVLEDVRPGGPGRPGKRRYWIVL